MSLLNSVIEQYDEEKLSDLLKILGVKEPAGDKKSMQEVVHSRLVKYTKMGPEYGPQALNTECLKITANSLKADYIDWVNDSEEQKLEFLYDDYKKYIRRQLKKMSVKKRKELAEEYKVQFKTEGSGAVGGSAALVLALSAGEAAGFALFTSTAVGMKALGMLFSTTFSFGAYQAVMGFLGVIFGPLGWSVAIGVMALGITKASISRRKTMVTLFMLTIILDYFAEIEEEVQKQLPDTANLFIGNSKDATLLPENSESEDSPKTESQLDHIYRRLQDFSNKLKKNDE